MEGRQRASVSGASEQSFREEAHKFLSLSVRRVRPSVHPLEASMYDVRTEGVGVKIPQIHINIVE